MFEKLRGKLGNAYKQIQMPSRFPVASSRENVSPFDQTAPDILEELGSRVVANRVVEIMGG